MENVQGDERDIIMFSVAYDDTVHNYGPLSQEGGENRLNVAITRAKEKIYLFKSREAKEYYGTKSQKEGPRLFVKYLQYAESISKVKVKKKEHFDSLFEEEVFNFIRDNVNDKKIGVHTQIEDLSFKIDLVVYYEDIPILAIECDGEPFHSSLSQREKDIHRQELLENRG